MAGATGTDLTAATTSAGCLWRFYLGSGIWPTFRDGHGPRSGGLAAWAVSRTRLRRRGRPAAAEHLPLDHLDVADASLGAPGVPLSGQALGDGVEVLLQAPGEPRDSGQVSGPRLADPPGEVPAGELGEHPGEGADGFGGGLELGTAAEHGGQAGLLVLVQVLGAAGEPAGDLADGRPGRWSCRGVRASCEAEGFPVGDQDDGELP
jgi:hypothetical protein